MASNGFETANLPHIGHMPDYFDEVRPKNCGKIDANNLEPLMPRYTRFLQIFGSIRPFDKPYKAKNTKKNRILSQKGARSWRKHVLGNSFDLIPS